MSLVLEGLNFQGDILKITRVTPDFIRLKGKMTPAAIETVVRYMEQNTEKLRYVSVTGLADAVRWVDRLLGAFTITTFLQLSPTWGVIQLGLLTNLWTKQRPIYFPNLNFFLGQVKDGFKFIEEFKMKSVEMTEPKQMLIL